MRAIVIGLGVVLASASPAGMVWYNGDGDGGNYFFAMDGANVTNRETFVFEDFTWNSASAANLITATTHASEIYSQIKWEIRQGLDLGSQSQGSLIASGTSSASLDLLSTSGFDSTYKMSANIGSVSLTNGGNYWLGLTIVVPSQSFLAGVSDSAGTGSFGSPVGNQNSVARWSTGELFKNVLWDGTGHDLAMGIGTSTVPEPASLAVLGLGALALVRRRKRG